MTRIEKIKTRQMDELRQLVAEAMNHPFLTSLNRDDFQTFYKTMRNAMDACIRYQNFYEMKYMDIFHKISEHASWTTQYIEWYTSKEIAYIAYVYHNFWELMGNLSYKAKSDDIDSFEYALSSRYAILWIHAVLMAMRIHTHPELSNHRLTPIYPMRKRLMELKLNAILVDEDEDGNFTFHKERNKPYETIYYTWSKIITQKEAESLIKDASEMLQRVNDPNNAVYRTFSKEGLNNERQRFETIKDDLENKRGWQYYIDERF